MCLEGPEEADEASPQLPPNGLARWQVGTQAHGGPDALYRLECQPSEDLPAAFIHLVKFFLKRTSPTELYEPMHQSVQCNINQNQKALLTTFASPFRMYVPLSKDNDRYLVIFCRCQNDSDTWAVGSGPACLAYHGALISRVCNGGQWQQWLMEVQYYTLNLTSRSDYVSEASLLQYKLDGVLAALTIVHLLVEPHPISPFVIYAASVTGCRELRKSVRQLIGLIPDCETRQLV
jgi:hypothetical protein